MAAVRLILRVTFSMFGKFSDLKSGIVRRNIMKKFYFFYLQSTPHCVKTLFFSYFGNLNKTSFYTKASAQTALNLHSFRNMNNLNPWSKITGILPLSYWWPCVFPQWQQAGSLSDYDGDAESNVDKKWSYILPTNLETPLTHLFCFSLSKRPLNSI